MKVSSDPAFARSPRKATLLGIAVVLMLIVLSLAACVQVQPGQWQAMGNSGSGIVLSIARDPFDPQLIYAGTSGGQVLRAIAGKTIVAVAGAGIPSNVVVDALAPDPHTEGTIYAATSTGLYVTTNNGDTWSRRGSGFPSNDTMDALAVIPSPFTLVAGSTQHGVFTSSDAGRTWRAASAGLPAHADLNTIYYAPNAKALLAAVDGAGIFVSTDGGATWHASNTGLPASVYAVLEVPAHGLNPTGPTLYAASSTGVYASVDTGAHWMLSDQGIPAGRVLSLAQSSGAGTTLYAGTGASAGTVYQSTDAGRTWTLVAPGLSHQVSSLASVTDSAGHPVLYAGAGELSQYPPIIGGGNSPGTVAINIALLVIVAVVGVYFFLRARRQLVETERRITRESAASRTHHSPPEDVSQMQNGHRPLVYRSQWERPPTSDAMPSPEEQDPPAE